MGKICLIFKERILIPQGGQVPTYNLFSESTTNSGQEGHVSKIITYAENEKLMLKGIKVQLVTCAYNTV